MGKKDPTKDDLRPENYLARVLKARTAFAPKSYSNAANFRRKREAKGPPVSPATKVDDDGIAILWKKDKFRAVELGFLKFPPSAKSPEKSEAVVAIVLEFKEEALVTPPTSQPQKKNASSRPRALINVLSTHLPSGDQAEKELERLEVLKDPKQNWEARRIVPDNGGSGWKEKKYSGSSFDGILSFVENYSNRRDGSTTVFALDANSRPEFPRIEHPGAAADGATTKEPNVTNVWDEIVQHPRLGLESVWVQTSELQKSGKPAKSGGFLVSVNKMRGPASNQPEKIGEHQCELIDHVFTNGRGSRLVESVAVAAGAVVATKEKTSAATKEENSTLQVAPKFYQSKDNEAELNLIPSLAMPSDHLPVVVDIELV